MRYFEKTAISVGKIEKSIKKRIIKIINSSGIGKEYLTNKTLSQLYNIGEKSFSKATKLERTLPNIRNTKKILDTGKKIEKKKYIQDMAAKNYGNLIRK